MSRLAARALCALAAGAAAAQGDDQAPLEAADLARKRGYDEIVKVLEKR